MKKTVKKSAGSKSAPKAVTKKSVKKPAKTPGVPADKDMARMLAFIRKHPGSTAEVVRDKLQMEPARASYVLGRLRLAGKVKGEGVTRGTKYTATETSAAAA